MLSVVKCTIKIASWASRYQICFCRGQVHSQNCSACGCWRSSSGNQPGLSFLRAQSRTVGHARVDPGPAHPLHRLSPLLCCTMSAPSTPEEQSHPSSWPTCAPCGILQPSSFTVLCQWVCGPFSVQIQGWLNHIDVSYVVGNFGVLSHSMDFRHECCLSFNGQGKCSYYWWGP